MFNFFLRITMCLLFLLLRKEKPEFSASSLQAWSISSLLYLLWLTNKSITSFPSESLSLCICNKTSKSSGISEFLSSFWKCKTEVMSSSDWPGAIASANHCCSFCLNLSNFWCSFCFVLSFRFVIFFSWFYMQGDWITLLKTHYIWRSSTNNEQIIKEGCKCFHSFRKQP